MDPINNSPPLEGCPKGGVVINNITLKLNPIIDLPYNPILKKRAKDLRQAENLSEVLFWMQVTKGRFHKIDFDRQRVIGNYIVDFYVKKLGLVIEIDGSSHEGKEEYDKERSDYLISLGLRVYRIQVVDVMQHLSMVMSALEEYLITEYGE
jgi:very-short-patch-repair endonuclease